MEMSGEGGILWASKGATDVDCRGGRLGQTESQSREGSLYLAPCPFDILLS